jgi:hypothetical protein
LINQYCTGLLLLTASAASADVFVRDDIITDPTYQHFSVCYEHSCQQVVTRSLSQYEWRRITAPLSVPLPTAGDERTAIAATVSNMETVVGLHTGTNRDKGGNLAGFSLPGQMDCIDESTNTTTYLSMLANNGLLEHHTVLDRVTRFGLLVGMPHTTAVIRETGTGRRFAVDAWFFDNGQPPVIVDLREWKSGWEPGEAMHE